MPDAGLLGVEPVYVLQVFPQELVQAVESGIVSLFPNAKVSLRAPGEGTCARISVRAAMCDLGLSVSGEFEAEGRPSVSLTDVDTEIARPCYQQKDREERLQARAKLLVQKLLHVAQGVPKRSWGILVGVRPVKLVHQLLDREMGFTEVEAFLREVYGIRPEKTGLLLQVARRQRKFFTAASRRSVSLYVGIPFCPTRCRYCSFAAYPLHSHGHLLPDFLRALETELAALGELISSAGLQVESWYFGGGTPTVLSPGELDRLLALLRGSMPFPSSGEFTVEAGRPDTITREKLEVLKQHGVSRISINPQTMQARTLEAVGRRHSVEDVISAFSVARQVGFDIINADLIIGLPGETERDISDTLRQMADLAPENLTVHSLAVKRAAAWRSEAAHLLYPDARTAVRMGKLAAEHAAEYGLLPYYLYRQRYIVGDLENIGYALPGTESVYNIQMMEERQTIIAAGGGAVSKFIDVVGGGIRRVSNPKCPATYAHRVEELIEQKKAALVRWLRSSRNHS